MEKIVTSDGIVIRRFFSQEDYAKGHELQKATWGADFVDLAAPALMMVAQKLGGVAAGAFDPDERLLGFVFGLTGIKSGELVHWSDMLAVRPEARVRGLGRRLKEFQRDLIRPLGIRRMLWSFDPLVARNAHFNFNVLGGAIDEYVIDMYGDAGETSLLSKGLGTDRFVFAWPTDPAIGRPSGGGEFMLADSGMPIVNTVGEGTTVLPIEVDGRIDFPCLVEVPHDIHEKVKEGAGRAWRKSTRSVFRRFSDESLAIRRFVKDASSGRFFYVVERESCSAPPTLRASE